MRHILIAALACSLASPALAQHTGHSMPMPAPKKVQPKAKPKPRPAPKATPAPKTEPKPSADPHAGHAMSAIEPKTPGASADPHAGHDMSAMEGDVKAPADDPHAGHHMAAMGEQDQLPIDPPPPGALSGPRNAADGMFDPVTMQAARRQLGIEHGGSTNYAIMLDRLEARIGNDADGYTWDAEGWYGGDIDKLWVKSEGEGSFRDPPEQAEVQALWSHAIGPWFDVQAGVRTDFRPDRERAHLVLGVQGIAPYWFEIDAAAFLSHKGDLTARIEAEYDQRITRRLILQPRIEIDLAAQNTAEIGVGSGLSSIEGGLRLRHEIEPEFAPYVGVEYARKVGNTADLARRAGDDVGGWSLLLGVRAWF